MTPKIGKHPANLHGLTFYGSICRTHEGPDSTQQQVHQDQKLLKSLVTYIQGTRFLVCAVFGDPSSLIM